MIVIHHGEANPKFPLITDGQLQEDILVVIGEDEEWLIGEIKKQGLEKYSDVFLGEYVNGNLILTAYPPEHDKLKKYKKPWNQARDSASHRFFFVYKTAELKVPGKKLCNKGLFDSCGGLSHIPRHNEGY